MATLDQCSKISKLGRAFQANFLRIFIGDFGKFSENFNSKLSDYTVKKIVIFLVWTTINI
jgi:hypothetical protein